MELRRHISKEIEKWYKNDKRALLIKGARQVGKTHIIRQVLTDLNCNFVEINLIKTPEAVTALRDSRDVNELVMLLSTMTDKQFVKGETVIFIDEVQRYKEMVTKIKFLVDEGSFRYVLSGSLLGVEISNLNSAPVGYLKTLDMYPLDFEEFLQITNISDEVTAHIRSCFNERKPVSEVIHNKMIELFDQYLVVGGMPEAVKVFAETHNLNDVLSVHRDIVSLYKLDFTQYEEENKRLVLTNIYDLVPSELLKQNRRFIVTDIRKGLHFDRVESSFLWLQNAGVVLSVYNSSEPRIPLKINKQQSKFKLYLSDVGMLTSIYGMSTKAMILSKNKNLNGGGIYENAVVCELASKGYELYYYNSNRIGELDLVIEFKSRTLPIEIKSGKDYTVHSALNSTMKNPEYEIEEAFVFANCNVSKRDKITYLPVYMAAFIDSKDDQDIIVESVKF